MRFFIFLIIIGIIASCCVFGTGVTFGAIYGKHPFIASALTILIIIYTLISRNPRNYGGKNITL